jgi:hypothetical protein
MSRELPVNARVPEIEEIRLRVGRFSVRDATPEDTGVLAADALVLLTALEIVLTAHNAGGCCTRTLQSRLKEMGAV